MATFMVMFAVAFAAPFLAFAWLMKPRGCPHCGTAIEPNTQLVRAFFLGES